MFNTILTFSAKYLEVHDEVNRYLSTDTENVSDVLLWWTECCAMYPCLSQMAVDYLSIPGMLISKLLITVANFFYSI